MTKKNWIFTIIAILATLFCFVMARAEASDGVACKMNSGAVVAQIIHDGDRVDFNKTQKIMNVTAISFMPQDVSDRLKQITKMNWNGGVLVKIDNGDGSESYMYVQRQYLACP